MLKLFFLKIFITKIWPKFKENTRLLYLKVQISSKKIKMMFEKKLFSYLSCGQIWLNLPMVHCHLNYNTKLTNKKMHKLT
jgi:hypothetical protein